MSHCDQNSSPESCQVGRKRAGALLYPPKKRPTHTDPIVRSGRHFGRTINAVTNIASLIQNGLNRIIEAETAPITQLPREDQREHAVFKAMLLLIPSVAERLPEASVEEVGHIADMLQKGINSARADDTKGIKTAIVDWITPKGGHLNPPLSRNIKSDRGFNHERTGALLCPAAWNWEDLEVKSGLRSGERAVPGEHWPLFLYENHSYDSENPWSGLFRGSLLILAHKYIFTSPSSVDKEPRATRSGNARIHGMTQVTMASIAYVATQVRFGLSSTSTFSRTDYVTDSERFYNTVMELLDDPRERSEINELDAWWNRKIFPSSVSAKEPLLDDTPLARIRAKRDREVAQASTANH